MHVVAYGPDGEPITIKVAPGDKGNHPRWSDAIKPILDGDCNRVEVHSDEGEVIRSLDLPDVEQRQFERSSQGGTTPLISVDVPRLVDNIAKNMRDVAKEAAAAQATAFQAGFTAMTNVVNLCIGMLNRVDARLEQLEENREPEVIEVESAPEGADRGELARIALLQALGGGGLGGGGQNGVNLEQLGKLEELMKMYTAQQRQKATAAPQTEPNGHAG